jgi:hypothetical protein
VVKKGDREGERGIMGEFDRIGLRVLVLSVQSNEIEDEGIGLKRIGGRGV